MKAGTFYKIQIQKFNPKQPGAEVPVWFSYPWTGHGFSTMEEAIEKASAGKRVPGSDYVPTGKYRVIKTILQREIGPELDLGVDTNLLSDGVAK